MAFSTLCSSDGGGSGWGAWNGLSCRIGGSGVAVASAAAVAGWQQQKQHHPSPTAAGQRSSWWCRGAAANCVQLGSGRRLNPTRWASDSADTAATELVDVSQRFLQGESGARRSSKLEIGAVALTAPHRSAQSLDQADEGACRT